MKTKLTKTIRISKRGIIELVTLTENSSNPVYIFFSFKPCHAAKCFENLFDIEN